MLIRCVVCATIFKTKNHKDFFCCDECYFKALNDESINIPWGKKRLICLNCKKIFIGDWRRKYCCDECKLLFYGKEIMK
jgi:hypothetical protein